MTITKIRHNADILQDTKQRAEEIYTNPRLQLGIYNIYQGTNMGITHEEGEDDTIFIVYVLDGELHFTSSNESFTLTKDDSVMISDIMETYFAKALTPCKLLMISSQSNHQKIQETNACFNKLVEVELKDSYTKGHGRRVSVYAVAIALELDPAYDILALGSAATFHDLGKYYTPIEILQKPGKLTDEEYAMIKKHPIDSYKLLQATHGEEIAQIALQHHERMDGSGYPYGLKKDDICFNARIVAVADVFDALTSHRVYNRQMSYEEAIALMVSQKHLYDPIVLNALVRLVKENRLETADE